MTARRVHVLLIALFAGSAIVRALVGLRRSTPLYYPDEYIYTAISRSIADTGIPRLRGDAFHFPSVLVSYLTAPAWLISDVSVAFHLVVAMGGIAFSLAVFPAYMLARRLGISPGGGLVVALLSILVPDAAFATTALTEPFAYPLFLATLLVAVDSIVSRRRLHQAAALVLMVALCLVRIQFLVIPVAYLVATVVREGGSWRAIRAHRAFLGAALLGLVGIVVASTTFYSGVRSHLPDTLRMGPWIAIELFGLAIASGWVLVPGAVVGFAELVRSPDPWRRTFAALAVSSTALIVLEAAYFDAGLHRIHERYTFYAAPLLAVACVFALQSGAKRLAYKVVAYGLVAAAIVLPATSWFHDADPSQAPAILGLQTFGTGVAQLAWALGFGLIALALAQSRRTSWAWLAGAAVLSAVLCVAGTRVLLRYAPSSHPGGTSNIDLYELRAPSHSALVTWAATDQYVLMKTLFWTRGVDRVLVLGGGKAADGFRSQPVSFGPNGIVDRSGHVVTGPFAFDLSTTIMADANGTSRWVRRSPEALILGLNREDRYLNTQAELLVAPAERRRTLDLVLKSVSGPRQLTFDCGGRKFRAEVGRAASSVRIPLEAGPVVQRCRISLTRGPAVDYDGSITSGVQVLRLALLRKGPAS